MQGGWLPARMVKEFRQLRGNGILAILPGGGGHPGAEPKARTAKQGKGRKD
jgi:hypothetical protein